MLIEVRIAQLCREGRGLHHTSRRWNMRKKLVELRQTDSAQHRLHLLLSSRDVMAGESHVARSWGHRVRVVRALEAYRTCLTWSYFAIYSLNVAVGPGMQRPRRRYVLYPIRGVYSRCPLMTSTRHSVQGSLSLLLQAATTCQASVSPACMGMTVP